MGDPGRAAREPRRATSTTTTTATFVRTRAASPAGITPTGQEVHAYVSDGSASTWSSSPRRRPGRSSSSAIFIRRQVGRLTVFDPARAAGRAGGLSAPAAGAGARAEQGFRIGGLRRRVGRPCRCDVRHRGVRHAGTGRTGGGGGAGAGAPRRVSADGAYSYREPSG